MKIRRSVVKLVIGSCCTRLLHSCVPKTGANLHLVFNDQSASSLKAAAGPLIAGQHGIYGEAQGKNTENARSWTSGDRNNFEEEDTHEPKTQHHMQGLN